MKNPRGFRGKYFSLAAILALSTTITLANETKSYTDIKQNSEEQVEYSETEELTPPSDELNVVIISKKIKVKEVDAPFASQIYTKAKIEKSRAKDVYEFLNTQTSITLAPSYGNKFSQLIDMRGYGIGNGYENVVISVDGRRLNNIDGMPQLLSSIPIESIEKIEIFKGSGSVEYGDGANAGVINIITKGYEGASIKTYIGDNGLLFGSLGLGIKRENFSLSGYIDDYSHDGYKKVAVDGTKDDSWNRNKEIKGTFTPIENLTFNLGKTFSKMQLKYPNALTLAEYNQDPNTMPSSGYSEQYFSSDVLSYGAKYKFTNKVSLNLQATDEKKVSNFITYSSKSDYRYKTYDAKLDYIGENFKTLFGIQKFEGERKNLIKTTTKENLGYYAKADYYLDNSTFSFGARNEKVEYSHKDVGKDLKDDESLKAFDLGYNYKLNKISSVFINLNQSFQAANIDRFFTFAGDFNTFIKPMKVKTINIGYNYMSYPNKLKISAFYSDIEDEIYYNSVTFNNTNFDKTKKLGFEVYDKFNIYHNLFTTLNYAYVDTEIKEDDANPSIVGNEIPGVSKHNVKVGLGYNPTHRINLLLSHVYKSEAYAMSDFDQSYGKMDAYNSTDFSATYKYKKYEVFAKVNNLLDRKNALFADSGFSLGVYPINYERNFMVGVSAKF